MISGFSKKKYYVTKNKIEQTIENALFFAYFPHTKKLNVGKKLNGMKRLLYLKKAQRMKAKWNPKIKANVCDSRLCLCD